MTKVGATEKARALVSRWDNCDACKGRGWLIVDNSDHGIRIEKCDACEFFTSDTEAVEHVAQAAEKWEDRHE